MRILLPITLACGMALPYTAADAQQAPSDGAPHGMVAVGVGAVPEYDGADDVRVLPFVMGEVTIGRTAVQLRGQGLRVDLAADPRLAIGPVVGARLPRDDANGAVGLLPEIGTAIEAGGFVGYRFGGGQYGQGALQVELSLVHDVSDTHDGLLATLGTSYAAVRTPDFFVSLDAQTTWASADYTRTYFGIDAAAATASGLPAYRPGSGFKDLGAGVTAGYWFSRRFGVIGRAGASYLVGDAAESPVTDEGRRWQPAGGLGLSYRF
ncbi:MipA/OmpV family protein [Sphingomonas sp.]|uniref:MipA/OmpV family protein n=1 Tax=Sphingomonas sp. TaxID=28214 RepID=UPI002C2079C4|nr:MipA/OmpV family protein [Sphingomonas sp.]HTG39196.1 MipA/OmpV family protein [Sphingomonas sp.]